jgi:DNA-binding NarL/FixJ family response regulator
LDLDDSLLSRLTAATTTPRDPRQAAILISDEPEGRAVVEAHFDGIVGFVRRTEASQEVITAAVVAGATREIRDDDDRLRRSEYRRRPIAQRRGDHRDELTGREIDVVALLADGLSTIEVAQRLGWSDRTVKKVIHGLLIRKGLRNRVHAVAYASRTGAI